MLYSFVLGTTRYGYDMVIVSASFLYENIDIPDSLCRLITAVAGLSR